jgi:PilZ domain
LRTSSLIKHNRVGKFCLKIPGQFGCARSCDIDRKILLQQVESEIGEAELSDEAQPATKTKHQRRFSRYRFDVRIQAAVFRDGITSTLWGRTTELGQDGLSATLSGELRAGEVVSLEFPIPLPPDITKVRAVVRYSAGLHCGFEFLVLTEQQKLTLHQVCVVLANAS